MEPGAEVELCVVVLLGGRGASSFGVTELDWGLLAAYGQASFEVVSKAFRERLSCTLVAGV
jgi:hypothetical protein